MNGLSQYLRQCEEAFLHIIAANWQLLPFPNTERQDILEALLERMTDRKTAEVMIASFPPDTQAALSLLKSLGGSMDVKDFLQKYGPVRSMGAVRLLREGIWKAPISPAERLLFSGFIFRTSQKTADGITERYTVPADLFLTVQTLIPDIAGPGEFRPFPVRPALPAETTVIEKGSDSLQDLACCLLSFFRQGLPVPTEPLEYPDRMIRFTDRLLNCAGVIPGPDETDTEKLRRFLLGNRETVQQQLFNTYANSPDYNEIEEDTGSFLLKEPLFYEVNTARRYILSCLASLKSGTWWSINGFLSAVEQENAAFLSQTMADPMWSVYDPAGNSLKGLGSWHRLEGEYIRFILSEPLLYLGVADLARETKEKEAFDAFRIRPAGRQMLQRWLSGGPLPEPKPRPETGIPGFEADGKITCLHSVPRMFRYQAGRYCELELAQPNRTVFRVSPSSLERARRNGLEAEGFLTLMKRIGKDRVPPVLLQTVQKWLRSGTTAMIYDAVVLSVPQEDVIGEILSQPRIAKWVLQQVNPTTLLIEKQGKEALRRYLMERGVFTEIEKN